MDFCMGRNVVHLLGNPWHFSFQTTEKVIRISSQVGMSSALRMLGMCFTYVFYGPVAYDKDSTWHSFKDVFQITTMLS